MLVFIFIFCGLAVVIRSAENNVDLINNFFIKESSICGRPTIKHRKRTKGNATSRPQPFILCSRQMVLRRLVTWSCFKEQQDHEEAMEKKFKCTCCVFYQLIFFQDASKKSASE